jgi:hypothetical protein
MLSRPEFVRDGSIALLSSIYIVSEWSHPASAPGRSPLSQESRDVRDARKLCSSELRGHRGGGSPVPGISHACVVGNSYIDSRIPSLVVASRGVRMSGREALQTQGSGAPYWFLGGIALGGILATGSTFIYLRHVLQREDGSEEGILGRLCASGQGGSPAKSHHAHSKSAPGHHRRTSGKANGHRRKSNVGGRSVLERRDTLEYYGDGGSRPSYSRQSQHAQSQDEIAAPMNGATPGPVDPVDPVDSR